MQNILFVPCFLLFIFFVMMPLSILIHELGHALALLKYHCNEKPVVICLGCKMTFDPRDSKYYRPASTWIIRWPRLLLIVAPSPRVTFFGITYGQAQLSTRQRFCMILAGPLASLGLTLASSAGAWFILHTTSQSQAYLNAFWLALAQGVFFLCCASASYNGLFFLFSILPRKRKSRSQKTTQSALGNDGYQILDIWREAKRNQP